MFMRFKDNSCCCKTYDMPFKLELHLINLGIHVNYLNTKIQTLGIFLGMHSEYYMRCHVPGW